jgi:hypothetical protein
METPEQRALARARANAQDTLGRRATDLGRADAGRAEHTDAYWAGALAQALRQLLDATAAEGEAR